MPIVFNFKVCDNAAECSGLAVCPVKAIRWDNAQKTLLVDNSKCTSCGLCAKACPVLGAILVAKTKDEYESLKDKVEDDPRTREELLKDRYGNAPTDQNLIVTMKNFDEEVIKTDRVAIVDFWDELHLGCRINSVPLEELLPKKTVLKEIMKNREKLREVKFKFRKIDVEKNTDIARRYNVKYVPSLLIFHKGKVLGRIEGAYSNEKKTHLNKKVGEIISKIRE
jgi:thioredoxin 1